MRLLFSAVRPFGSRRCVREAISPIGNSFTTGEKVMGGRRIGSLTLSIALIAGAGVDVRADQILFWNQEIQTLEALTPAPTPMAAGRDLATMNVAMYDAVNAAAGSPNPSFYPTGPVTPGSSPEAAADAAAYRFLSQRFTGQTAQITAAYSIQISSLPNNAATTNGLTLGQNQTSIVLTARANDGSSSPGHFTPGVGPGQWQPPPPFTCPISRPTGRPSHHSPWPRDVGCHRRIAPDELI